MKILKYVTAFIASVIPTILMAAPTQTVQWGYDPLSTYAIQYKNSGSWAPIPSSILAFTISGTGAVTETIYDKLSQYVDIRDFGAKCDGVTDDSTAIQNALNSFSWNVRITNCNARISTTINIPNSKTLEGNSFSPGNNIASGAQLLCDANVTPCLQGGANNFPFAIKKLRVVRAGGKPATNLIGILIQNAGNVIIEDVMAQNHGVGYYVYANSAQYLGLGAYFNRTYSGAISGAHVVVDGWPELRINQSRFGLNGLGDYDSSAIFRLKGGAAGTASGPNTLTVINCQINHGGGQPAVHLMELVDLGAGGLPGIDAAWFTFIGNHIENFSPTGSLIYSDSSWNVFNKFIFADNFINTPTTKFWDLNPATYLDTVNINNNNMYIGGFTLNPNIQNNFINFTGNRITSSVSIAAGGGGGASGIISNNTINGNYSVSGQWSNLVSGPNVVFGTISDTTTGIVQKSYLNGSYTFPGLMLMSAGNPTFLFKGLNQPLDKKNWDIYEATSGDLTFRSLDDGITSANEWLKFIRGSGYEVNSMRFNAISNFYNYVNTNKYYLSFSSTPSVSSCGTSPGIDGQSSNTSGRIVFGGGGPTSCTLTFADSYPGYAYCTLTRATNYAGNYYVSSNSATGFTVTTTTAADGAAFNYTCMGR